MLHLLLAAQLAPVPGIYHADRWIPDGGDLADAIHAIQLDEGCAGRGPQGKTGCKVVIPRGVYRTKTIHICRGLIIEGVGGRGWGAATVIETDGETGIRVEGHHYCAEAGFGEPGPATGWSADGSWSRISDLALDDVAGPARDRIIYSAGVHLEARAAVRDVWIRGFTQGVRVSADVTRTETSTVGWRRRPNTNANLVKLQDVFVSGARHAGLYFDGGDANAGYTLGIDASGACADGTRYAAAGFGPCASILDSSFLGNTHLATHTAVTLDADGYQHHQHLSEGPSGRNVWVGSYAEQGNGPSEATQGDVVLGGIATFGGDTALIAQDRVINGFCSARGVDGGRACLGTTAGTGAVAFESNDPGWGAQHTLRLKAGVVQDQRVWRWDVANLDGAQAAWIAAEDGPRGPRASTIFRAPLALPMCAGPSTELAGLGLEDVGSALGVCRAP